MHHASTAHHMILILFLLMQTFPDTFAPDCLQCYQCSSYSDDPNPYCDSDYWYTLTVKKKRRYIVGCSEGAGDFCIKKTIFMKGGRRLIERGCIGGRDSNGVELKQGCAFVKGEIRMSVCFCTKNLCNLSIGYVKTDNVVLIGACLVMYFSVFVSTFFLRS